jgi:hypothetical protein
MAVKRLCSILTLDVTVQASDDRIPVYTRVIDLGKFTAIVFGQVRRIYVFM